MYKNSEGLRVLFKFYEEEQKQQTHITEQNFLTFCLELSLQKQTLEYTEISIVFFYRPYVEKNHTFYLEETRHLEVDRSQSDVYVMLIQLSFFCKFYFYL